MAVHADYPRVADHSFFVNVLMAVDENPGFGAVDVELQPLESVVDLVVLIVSAQRGVVGHEYVNRAQRGKE